MGSCPSVHTRQSQPPPFFSFRLSPFVQPSSPQLARSAFFFFLQDNVSEETIGQLQQFPLPVLKEIRAWGQPSTQSAGVRPFLSFPPFELELDSASSRPSRSPISISQHLRKHKADYVLLPSAPSPPYSPSPSRSLESSRSSSHRSSTTSRQMLS